MFQSFCWMVVVVQIATVVVWLWQHVLIHRITREQLRVPVFADSGCDTSLTVIVPVRNEQHQIQACMSTILNQHVKGMRVIVVDDRSTDDTLNQVRQIESPDIPLDVLHIDTLPDGWLGKSHALWTAVQHSNTEWLLFLDADCRLRPFGIVSALTYARRFGADLLSLWPQDGSVTFWARLLIPLCGAQIAIWYGRDRVNDPESPSAFANGQFILIRRDAYLRMGGHHQVRNALIEDVPLAHHAKAQGLSVRVALGADVYSVSMYDTLSEIVSGWTRIYRGVLTPMQILACMLWLLIGSALPFLILPWVTSNPVNFSEPLQTLLLSGSALHLVALASVSVRFFSLSRCRLQYLLLYPVSIVGVFLILSNAMTQSIFRTTVTWKGTSYQVDHSKIRGTH